jgi:RecA/RadA recombinase
MKKEITEQIKDYAKKKTKSTEEKKILFSSGCDLLDLIHGGHPIGKVINIVGDKSSGKTFLTLEIIAAAIKKYGNKVKWIYDDAEAGFSFDSKELFGFDAFKYTDEISENVEQMSFHLDNQLEKVKKDEFLIYVIDSLDGLSSHAEQKRREEAKKAFDSGKDYDKGSYQMEKQKFLSEFFRVYANKIRNKNCLLIIISQVRDNIGVKFGAKHKRSGGKALDFYSSQIIWLAEAEKIKAKDRTIGITIKARTTKNKTKYPFRSGFIRLYFDFGIDNITTNLLYLYDLITDTGKTRVNTRTKIEWDKVEYKFNDLILYIEENNLEDELSNRVKEKWNKIEEEISIANKRKKRF